MKRFGTWPLTALLTGAAMLFSSWAGAQPRGGAESTGLKPLNEMGAEEAYKGEDGGLYGRGANTPPEEHLAAALKSASEIVPLDAASLRVICASRPSSKIRCSSVFGKNSSTSC